MQGLHSPSLHTQRQLKEALYNQIINYFDQGKVSAAWGSCSPPDIPAPPHHRPAPSPPWSGCPCPMAGVGLELPCARQEAVSWDRTAHPCNPSALNSPILFELQPWPWGNVGSSGTPQGVGLAGGTVADDGRR